MSSTPRHAATLLRGEWVTELTTPGGPFYEVAVDCDGATLVVYIDPIDHEAGTVELPLQASDGVRVWSDV